MTLPFTLSSLRLRAFRYPAPPYPFLFSRPLKSAVAYLHLLLASVKGTVANSMLFAPVPCSVSINKSSAYHFGPVRVRILLVQNRVMADAQVPVQAAVPAAQALVQPPAAPANVDNPQQDPAPLQVLISFLVICSLDCVGFPPFVFALLFHVAVC